MDLQFTTACLPYYHLGHSFATARALGLSSLELALTPVLLHEGAGRVLSLTERHGVAVRSLSVGWAGRAPLTREEIGAIARFATALPDCRVLVLPAPTGGVTGGLGAYLNLLRAFGDALAGRRVALTVENAAPPGDAAGPGPLDHFPQLRRFVEEWDLGFTFDTSHAAGSGWVITEPLPQVGKRLRNVHLSDFRSEFLHGGTELLPGGLRDQRLHLPPGTGVLPLRAFLRALRRQEYRGLLTLDLRGPTLRAWWPPTARARLADALAFCRAALRDAGTPRAPLPERLFEATAEAEAEAENEG